MSRHQEFYRRRHDSHAIPLFYANQYHKTLRWSNDGFWMSYVYATFLFLSFLPSLSFFFLFFLWYIAKQIQTLTNVWEVDTEALPALPLQGHVSRVSGSFYNPCWGEMIGSVILSHNSKTSFRLASWTGPLLFFHSNIKQVYFGNSIFFFFTESLQGSMFHFCIFAIILNIFNIWPTKSYWYF